MSGKLTAEQVSKAVNGHGNIMDNRLYCDWQAIADELSATLGEQPAKSGADALSRRARDMARNIQGNLGRCLYRRKDVAEMEEVSETLMELANELNAGLCVSTGVDDALAILDEIREAGRISYDDYSQLFDAIAAIGGVNPDGLPNGLTISDDGDLLNWRGENYVRQSTLGGGECELMYGEDDDGVDGWYTHCGGWFAATRKDGRMVIPPFCQLCGEKAWASKAVKQ